jgi:large subunit ribosomal protein L5
MENIKELHDKARKNLSKGKKYGTIMAVPKLEKIVLNAGIGSKSENSNVVDEVKEIMKKVTGQNPVETKAKTAVSNFNLKKGDIVGLKVTLRGDKMWRFADKFVSVVLPRFRDFEGLNESAVDQAGNLHVGVNEHTVFLEIDSTEVENVHSLQVSFVTDRNEHDGSLELFKGMSVPFIDN